jgi:DNA-directed RNA polymerase specialized sigma24 family protein
MTYTEPETLHLEDAVVIERSLRDPDRFAEIFDRHYAEIHGFASRRLGSSLADDVAAETFLIAFDGGGGTTCRTRAPGRGCTGSPPT